MKLNLTVYFIAVVFPTIAFAGGITGPCTKPEGVIQVAPNVTENGRNIVPLGKNVTFTASGLKDKDCYCGKGVQDSIDASTGVQWVISSGTFTGGDKGTPKTWKAPKDPVDGLDVILKLDDKATAANTTNDGGFQQVASIKINVVKPNSGSNNSPAAQQCPHADRPTLTFGKYKHYTVTCARVPVNLDFSGLYFNESGGAVITPGCNIGIAPANNNVPDIAIGAGNSGSGDLFAPCQSFNFMLAATCTDTFYVDWSITAGGAGKTYHDWGRFNGSFTVPNPGGIQNVSITRTWGQAL